MKSIMDKSFSLKCEPVELDSVFEKLKALTGLQARLKGLKLAVEYYGPEYSCVMSDERRLLQLLLNLTSNAIKYTSKGEVSVVGRMSPAWVLEIQVNDTGIGIDSAAMHKIFELFGLIDRKAKASETG